MRINRSFAIHNGKLRVEMTEQLDPSVVITMEPEPGYRVAVSTKKGHMVIHAVPSRERRRNV